MSSSLADLHAAKAPSEVVASIGMPGAVLLGGPRHRLDLSEHHRQRGDERFIEPREILEEIRASGLLGRGGGAFPLAAKIDTALECAGPRVLIINVAESEPLSAKDATLASLRPHSVLDGARAIASILGVRCVSLLVHGGSAPGLRSLELALDERRGQDKDPEWKVVLGDPRYVAGESSAVASKVAGGPSLPLTTRVPLAVRGPSGNPTVVTNAETAAHVAMILRLGSSAWRAHGPSSDAGSRLVTLVGSVRRSGEVVELLGAVTIGELLEAYGVSEIPAAVLIGGFGGRWIDGETAWNAEASVAGLSEIGTAFGCGLIGVIPRGGCVVGEVARLARYLADESAGQCGPCALGLPAIADDLERVASGRGRPRHVRRLLDLAGEIEGRGACGHPDAAIAMVRSGLRAAGDDLGVHLTGKTCGGGVGALRIDEDPNR